MTAAPAAPHRRPIVVTCAKALAPFVGAELEALGLSVTGEDTAHVETMGTMHDAMRINLCLRTGQRVLVRVSGFAAETPDELYYHMVRTAWEEYIPADGYLCVTSSVDTPSIKNTQFANVRCKDAICDRIREKCGRRPDSGPERNRTVVHLYWQGGRCVVYLDTSGEPLHLRGYRINPLKAPMQETLAAAVVRQTGWTGMGSFVNPMCGSGTLAIEAALFALDRPPGLLRGNFGFMHLVGYDRTAWERLRTEATRAVRKRLSCRIVATDISAEAVEAARQNAVRAGVDGFIEFARCDFAATAVPEGGGVIVLNPEYGERLGDADKLAPVYKRIGDFLKQKCGGYHGFIFTGNLDLAKAVGLRAKRRHIFYNSTIECRLLEYELYEGSRERRDV